MFVVLVGNYNPEDQAEGGIASAGTWSFSITRRGAGATVHTSFKNISVTQFVERVVSVGPTSFSSPHPDRSGHPLGREEHWV